MRLTTSLPTTARETEDGRLGLGGLYGGPTRRPIDEMGLGWVHSIYLMSNMAYKRYQTGVLMRGTTTA